MEDLRDSVQVQRGRVRGNTPEGAEFFFSQKVRLVFCFFCFFEGGPFMCRYICCQEDRFTGGTLFCGKEKSPTLKFTFLP